MRKTIVWEAEQSPVNAGAETTRLSTPLWDAVLGFLSRVKIGRKPNALRLAETLLLGDRRMLAIVEWRGETLLLGVTPQQITLLEAKTDRVHSPEEQA